PLRVDGGYVGLDVHRAARICAAGHGGQVLLSEATVAALADASVPLRDLGEHRLRGLDQPERIHQLGDGDFPPLRADAAVGVLVLSQYVESGYALELLQRNAEGVGYLLKDRVSDVKEFAAAVKRVADGGSALDSEVVSRLVGRRRGEDPISQLTPREREVMELMAEGRSNQAIAERLVVTLRAVE